MLFRDNPQQNRPTGRLPQTLGDSSCPWRLLLGVALAAGLAAGGCPADLLTNPDADGGENQSGSDTAGVQASKNRAPVAAAGADRTVAAGELVVLNGTGTKDEDGDALIFIWQQIEGDAKADLVGIYSSIARFVAPDVSVDTELTFRLIAVDGAAVSTDDVIITIAAPTE
ncbi:MAG: hypothetical protein HRU75_12630 [Planctomycetia bacterium]|nr:MAG: hypothetical protein HRU75_12630 [Planctomycetia bacterium]